MSITFCDIQDSSNPFNSSTVSNPQDLLTLLNSMLERSPFFCELVGDNGYKLLVGIGPRVGCAQYSPADGGVPYLMAVAPKEIQPTVNVGFLTGDTLSPVPGRYCLPIEVIKRIASDFVETGTASSVVEWEEI